MIDYCSIKPEKIGKSDFFSWQLYRWVKNNKYQTQIFEGTWNSATGIDRERPVLYVGVMDSDKWLHGRMLRNLCLHGASIESYAYGPGHDTKNWIDITEHWWEKYYSIGVCAIHGDNAHKWENIGDTRTCCYCKKKEHRTVERIEIEKIVWSCSK